VFVTLRPLLLTASAKAMLAASARSAISMISIAMTISIRVNPACDRSEARVGGMGMQELSFDIFVCAAVIRPGFDSSGTAENRNGAGGQGWSFRVIEEEREVNGVSVRVNERAVGLEGDVDLFAGR